MNVDLANAPPRAPHRLNLLVFGADAMRAMALLEQRIAESGLERTLVELVRLRVSQLNGCAFCIDKHAREARDAGVDERRLALLPAWREASLFAERERGALRLAEVLTRVVERETGAAARDRVADCFLPSEWIDLLLLITVTNTWNRLAIGSRWLSAPDR